MFITENNVPQVYVEQSRDFQLFCRLLDVVVNSVRYDTTAINHISVDCIDDRLVYLMLSRMGIKIEHENTDYYRALLSVYAKATRYKGSLASINYIINAFLRLSNLSGNCTLEVDKQRQVIKLHLNTQTLNQQISSYLLNTLQYFIGTTYTVEIDYVINHPVSYKLYNEHKVEINPITPIYYAANNLRYFDTNNDDYKVLLSPDNNGVFDPQQKENDQEGNVT